jgi:hypothetical protein
MFGLSLGRVAVALRFVVRGRTVLHTGTAAKSAHRGGASAARAYTGRAYANVAQARKQVAADLAAALVRSKALAIELDPAVRLIVQSIPADHGIDGTHPPGAVPRHARSGSEACQCASNHVV